MKAVTGAVHTHACVPCSFCPSRGLRPRCSAVAPQATDWLLAPGSTRSLRPAARAAWERSARAHCVSCWCTSRAVSTGGVSANTETATMRATTAAVHTHARVLAQLVCLAACGDGVRQRLVTLRHCLPTCHQRRQQLTNRGGGCTRESSHQGQDRHQSEHGSICVSSGQQR